MTRDEIYDHLAKVYLGKKNKVEEKKRQQFNAWLVINIFITLIIFASAFYGLTAFLGQRRGTLQDKIIFALNNGPIRIQYDLEFPYPPVKTFSLSIPKLDAGTYKKITFSIRELESLKYGIVKIQIKNSKSEQAAYFLKTVNNNWQEFNIPLEQFKEISDWSNLTDISFVLESWNTKDKKGVILIDNISFSS